MSDSSDVSVEVGEWYRLRTYGDVFVYAITRHIDAVTSEGVSEEELVVEFEPENAYNDQTRILGVEEFIGEVMSQ